MKKEIEKRFLLKNLPINTIENLPEVQHIQQYYYLVDGIWNRIRKIESSILGITYLHTIKTYIDGITYEEEKDFSFDEYKLLMNNIHSGMYEAKFLDKTRYIYNTGTNVDFGDNDFKNIKWEIDVFNFSLIIAEIEIPDITYNIEIPEFIQKEIILEITDIKELSNRNLANFLKF